MTKFFPGAYTFVFAATTALMVSSGAWGFATFMGFCTLFALTEAGVHYLKGYNEQEK